MAERTGKNKISSVLYNRIISNNASNKDRTLLKLRIILSLICFFSARNSIADELFPFAISFLCAYYFYSGQSIFMFVICALGILSAKGSPIYLISLLFIYIYFFKNKDNENKNIIHISIIISAMLFLLKTMMMAINGFEIEILIINCFEGMLVFSSTYIIYKGITSLNIIGYIKKDNEKTICFCITIFIAMLGFKDVYILNFSMLKCIEYFIIPFCACYLGPSVGALTGFIFGFVNGTSINDTSYYVATLSFSGILTGFICNKHKLYGGAVFPAVAAVVFYYFGSISIFKSDILELLAGFVIYFLIIFFNDRKIRTIIDKEHPQEKINNTYNKLNKLSKAIEEICTAYREGLEKEYLKDENEIDEIVNEVYGRQCLYCSKHNICWKNNFNKTYYYFVKIVKNISKGKTITGDNYLRKIGCKSYNEIIKNIYRVISKQELNTIRQKELNKSKKAVIDQLLETSLIISDTAKEIKYEDVRNKKTIECICRLTEEKGITITCFDVLGRKDDLTISVTYSSNKSVDKSVEIIINIVYKVTGVKIYCSEKTITLDQYYVMKFNSRKKLKAKTYYSRISKNNSRISGDSFTYGDTEDKYYVILSDGMGTGAKALNESRSTVDILSKLTEANFQEKQLLKTMNSLLMLKFEDERYTTVDLCIVDLIEYEARFYKAGAATTYIIRNNEVVELSSNSLPVGILDDMDYQFNKSKIRPGDRIIMITDGIIDSINMSEKESLQKYLNTIKDNDSQTIANLVLTYAIRGCKDIIDDMTVLVTKVTG